MAIRESDQAGMTSAGAVLLRDVLGKAGMGSRWWGVAMVAVVAMDGGHA